jgi:hypothetical protein
MSSSMSLSDVPGGEFLSDDTGDGSLPDDSMDTEEFERQFTRVTSPELDADHTPATMEQLCALERELREKRRRYDPSTISSHVSILRCLESTLTGERVLQLRREYEQAVQDEQSLASAIEDDLAFHGASECLELTEKMCDMLPVELREMINRFLCIEEQPIPVGPYYHFRPYSEYRPLDGLASALSSGRDQIDHTKKPDPTILMPDSHIFNYEYVGLTVAAEMQAAYFTNNTFSICDVEDGIAEFFQGAIFLDAGGAIGILNMPEDTSAMSNMRMSVRAFKLVRKLQIRLKLEHFGRATDARDLPPGPIGIREKYAEERNFLRQSKNALHRLQSLPRGGQPLQLEFIIMTNLSDILRVEDRERCFINILEAYRNTFYALKYDHENAIITIIHHDESVSPFPRTLSALWSLTKEQWEHVSISLAGPQTLLRHDVSGTPVGIF